MAIAALTYFPTVLSVALRPAFCFHQAQYAQVFPLKPAPICKLFAGLGRTCRSAIFLLFSYLTLALSLPLCPLHHLSFYLNLSGRNCFFFPPSLLGYNGSTDIGSTRGMTWLTSWPDGERYSGPQQSLVVSLLLSLAFTLLLCRTEGVYCLIEVV